MNYCDKISYQIYTTEKAEFEVMVDNLLAQLSEDKQLLRLVFFGTPDDNEQYVARRVVLSEKVHQYYGDRQPVLTYVSQPSLKEGLQLEAHLYRSDADDTLSYKSNGGFPYVLLENNNGRFLFAGGFHGDVLNWTIERQSKEVFTLVSELLKKEGFPVNSIIRQWNYIEQITKVDGADQHYQIFNNARSDYYATTNWDNGYPAATGIGANLGGVLVDFDAALFTTPTCYATPIDNKLQVAAHAYSDDVLKTACSKKSTPKFERAKSMTFGDRKLIYISGTAAIRGEESLSGVGLKRQLYITMENIAELVGEAKLKMLRVYLKEKSFFQEAKQLLDDYNLNIPIVYMCADVCRDELLIEIEGIAIL